MGALVAQQARHGETSDGGQEFFLPLIAFLGPFRRPP